MGHREPAILRPPPIHSGVQFVRERADLALGERAAAKVLRRREHPREQEGRIDGRELALPALHAHRICGEPQSPTATMLAGQSLHVLSATNPLARLVSYRK